MRRIIWLGHDRFKSLGLGIIISLLCASLLLGCSSDDPSLVSSTPQPSTPAVSLPSDSPTNPPAGEQPQMPESLRDAVLMAIAVDQSVPADQLQLIDATAQIWPDGCLGLADAGEFCTLALVDGWAATVTDGEHIWIYRTDSDGTQIRLESKA
ncbi:MAG: hypothetical protein AAF215_29350 [Cyanobacteria bacterium P01_A01_bin.123]